MLDVIITTVVLAVVVVDTVSAESHALRVAAAEGLQASALAFRRTWVAAAGLLFLAGTAVELAPPEAPTGDAGVLALLLLLFSLGRYDPWQRSAARVLVWASLAALVGAETATSDGADLVSDLLVIALTSAGAYAVGATRRRQVQREAEFSESLELRDRSWEARSREIVEAERRRIAVELHDIVGHALAGISVSAGAARSRPGTPPEVAESLNHILTASQEAAADVRRLVGLVRADADLDIREPQPTLASIEGLVAQVRRVGVDVDVVEEGTPIHAARSTQLVAYRLVQEGLTNAMRHRPGAPVTVHVRWQPDRLDVGVVDAGTGPTSSGPGDGHGLTGLRERVLVHGGTFEAGATPSGGFRVAASLPLT